MRHRLIGAAALFGFVAVIALSIWAIKGEAEWEDWCHAQGGHIDRTSEIVFIGREPTTDYTTYCLTSDRKIIDIRE